MCSYRSVIGHTRELDPTRPVTFVCNKDFENDLVVSNLHTAVVESSSFCDHSVIRGSRY